MKEILEKWLFNCLGIAIPMENLGQELRDGVLLAKLLKHYGVVNDKTIKNIVATDNPSKCEKNLRQLSIWFQLLNVKISTDTFFSIANGKTSTSLHLLYDLYLALHKKEKFFFMNTENYFKSMKKQSNTQNEQLISQPPQLKTTQKFTYNESPNTKCTSRLQSYILKQKDSFKKKAKGGCSSIKICKINKNNDFKNDKLRNEDIEFVRNTLTFTSFQIADSNKKKILPITDIQSSTEEKDSSLRLQNRIFSTFKDLHKDCENVIMNSIWKAIEHKEKEHFKKQIAQKLLQQSDYEKQNSKKQFQKTFQDTELLNKFLEIKQKVEEESKNIGYFSSCKTSEEEIHYQIEMIKKMDIHKKLYADKLKKRNKKRYGLCFQIINNIIDLAIKKSHFGKEYVNSDLWSEWKQMFISEQQVLETTENEESKSAEISLIERESQFEHSDERQFEEYLYLIGDWIDHTRSDLIFDEHNILGNIIHRLFDIQNPPPFEQKPAHIPKYIVSAILNGLNDESDLVKLKLLLMKSKICLVDLNSAINFCIECYKNEADIKEELPLNKKGKITPNKKTLKQEDSKNNKTGTGAGKGAGKGNKDDGKIDKEIQTASSLMIIVDSKELTPAAKLGKDLYSLETFDNIPVHLKVEIIIEYLKKQPNINGWVLVNFPCTLKEAYIIEKTFSGKKFPKKFKQQLSSTKIENSLNQHTPRTTLGCWDEYNAKYSRLVQFPPSKCDNFVTYFTSFIQVKTQETELHNGSTSRTKLSVISNETQLKKNSIISEDNEIQLLTEIYKEQGISHNFLCETMNLDTLKKLARVIVKDFIMTEDVSSIELFGEETLQFLTPIVDSKGKKSPKKGKDDPAAIYEILKQNHFMDDKQEEFEETEAEENIESESELEIKPGNKDWITSEFYISEDMATYLANLWEEMEVNYIKQITEILKKRKQSQNLISPYVNYISQTMAKHFKEDTESQNTIKKFLDFFNGIPRKKRTERKTKDELGRGVFTTELKLWEISHTRKEEAEDKRKTLIAQNWTAEEIIEIANNYILLLQIEVNRCRSTIYILHQYYSIMCEGNIVSNFQFNIKPPKIQSIEGSEEKLKLISAISKILTDESNMNMRNPMYDVMEGIFQNLQTEITKLSLNLLSFIENYEKIIFSQIKEYKVKTTVDKKKRKQKNLQTDEDKISSPSLVEAKFNDIKKMFLEWSYSVKSECDRINCRIKIIKSRMQADIDNLEKIMTSVFHNFKQKVKADYLKHNENVDKMCEIFNAAIIENTPVLNNMELLDKLFPLSHCDLKVTSPQSFFTSIEEDINSQCFTIKQLKFISERLKIISPNGIISKNALLYIIEDLIFCEQEKENIKLFPKIWNEMSSLTFEKLFRTVYGLNDTVNWKDFIIYCMELQFPEMEDIINNKMQFKLCDKKGSGFVTYDDYMNIKFWFEQSTNNSKYNSNLLATKQFLFSLFQVNEKEMNYTEFTLSFCKDLDPNIGFGKGLAYFLGQCVIVSDKQLYLEKIMRDYDEQLNNMMKEILNQIIFDVVNTFAGIRIEEITDSTAEKLQKEIDSKNTDVGSTASEIIEHDKERVIEEILYNTELEKIGVSQRVTVDKDKIRKRELEKETQTISFSELLTDEYMKVNKIFQWTSKVPKTVINSLLEAIVYPTLSSELYKTETENIVWKLKRTIAFFKDEYVYVPWLLNQRVMQDLFCFIHCFKIFSFPSIVEGISEHPCT